MQKSRSLKRLGVIGWLAFAVPSWSQVSPGQMQVPVRESVQLDTLVAPALGFGARTVTPMRSKIEHGLAGSSWIYLPLVAANPADGEQPPSLRALLRVARYRYGAAAHDEIEVYREFIQEMLTKDILPAALEIPELADFHGRFTEIEAVIDDDSRAIIGMNPWDAAVGPRPTITVQYELSHTLAQHAYALVAWDRLMGVDRQNPEAVYAAFNGWLNAYTILLLSEYSQLAEELRLFDQGVIETLFNPSPMTIAERVGFSEHTRQLNLAVLSHEACHHILDHRVDTGKVRRDIEVAADLCAARLFHHILSKRSVGEPASEQRHQIYWVAARDLAQTSQLTWSGAGGVTSTDYPDPNTRYRAIIDAIPAEIVQSLPPDYATAMSKLPNALLPEIAMSVRAKLDLIAVFNPDEEEKSEAFRLSTLWEIKDALEAYCAERRCLEGLAAADVNTRYFSARSLIDLAALQAELAWDAVDPSAMRSRARTLATHVDEVMVGMPVAHGLVTQVLARLDKDR